MTGEGVAPSPVTRIESYVYEPHPAVLAANLAGDFANLHGLGGVTARGGYLTGTAYIETPLARRYVVTEVMPFRAKRVRSALQSRGVGHLVVKKRGVTLEPERVARECNPRAGEETAVVLLTRIERRTVAILAREDKTQNDCSQ